MSTHDMFLWRNKKNITRILSNATNKYPEKDKIRMNIFTISHILLFF